MGIKFWFALDSCVSDIKNIMHAYHDGCICSIILKVQGSRWESLDSVTEVFSLKFEFEPGIKSRVIAAQWTACFYLIQNFETCWERSEVWTSTIIPIKSTIHWCIGSRPWYLLPSSCWWEFGSIVTYLVKL